MKYRNFAVLSLIIFPWVTHGQLHQIGVKAEFLVFESNLDNQYSSIGKRYLFSLEWPIEKVSIETNIGVTKTSYYGYSQTLQKEVNFSDFRGVGGNVLFRYNLFKGKFGTSFHLGPEVFWQERRDPQNKNHRFRPGTWSLSGNLGFEFSYKFFGALINLGMDNLAFLPISGELNSSILIYPYVGIDFLVGKEKD